MLQELMAFKTVVVSTGGGAVLKRLNWGYMQHAIVVWLHGAPELLAQRAMKDDFAQRPLLSNGSSAVSLILISSQAYFVHLPAQDRRSGYAQTFLAKCYGRWIVAWHHFRPQAVSSVACHPSTSSESPSSSECQFKLLLHMHWIIAAGSQWGREAPADDWETG